MYLGLVEESLPQTDSVPSVYRAISCFNKHIYRRHFRQPVVSKLPSFREPKGPCGWWKYTWCPCPTPRRLDVLKFPRCSNHTKGKQPGGTPKKKKRPEDGKWYSSESVPLREKPVVTLGEKRSRGRQKRCDKKWVKQATRGRRHGRERPDRPRKKAGRMIEGGKNTAVLSARQERSRKQKTGHANNRSERDRAVK